MRKDDTPEIRIKYGWLLASVTSGALNEKFGDGSAVASYDEFNKITTQYSAWWNAHENEIIEGICNILDLRFRQNIIDIYVSPWFTPISDPMTIGPGFKTSNSLINILTHELIHRLITDNTSIEYDHDFVSDWVELFGKDHNQKTLVHIPVHATMKQLYLDTLNRPDLLELDIETTKHNKPYADAWKYVQANDYTAIVKSLTASKFS